MKVVVIDDWNSLFVNNPAVDRLKKRIDLEVLVEHQGPNLLPKIQDADAVVLNRERTPFRADRIAALPNLKLIVQTGGVGGNVDVAAASERGIYVSAGGGLPNSIEGVAELSIGMLIVLARNLLAYDRAVREGRWTVDPTMMLNGSTMGILGLGRLGKSIARTGKALGMKVIASGPTLTEERAAESDVGFVSLDELFKLSDSVFICPRLSDLTRGMVTRAHLESMKPTAFIINAARGPIVDEAALLDVLQQKKIGGAGLDVFGQEPLPADHPILKLDNVVLAPHIGWVSKDNTDRFVENVVRRIEEFLDGDFSRATNVDAVKVRN